MSLKNEQYNQIRREYDRRQLKNKHDLDLRRENAFESLPELKVLENELITLSAQSGRLALSGDSKSLSELKAKTAVLEKQKEELLLSNGFPKDYLSLRYECSKCKDTGFIGNDKCSCFKQAIVNIVYADSNLKSILNMENFSKFSFDYYSDELIDESIGLSPLSNIQKIVACCKSFIRHFENKKDNLLFLGNTGVGKTFLANCIAKELLDHGFTVIYLTAFGLFDILEKNKFSKDEENTYIASNKFDYILDCDLLIIDDLGTELNNTFTTSQLYLCINERLLRKKSTIISTNLSLDNLNTTYSERIFSRIISNYSIQRIIGEDIRLHKALKKA